MHTLTQISKSTKLQVLFLFTLIDTYLSVIIIIGD